MIRRFVHIIKKQLFIRKKKLYIIRKYKYLKVRRKLTKEQKKEIQDFYLSVIGKKIPLYMHEYFYSRNGIFSKYYVPESLFFSDLLPKANDSRLIAFYTDKNFTELFFPGENIAHSVLQNINGYYYFENEVFDFFQ